jgi:hypothetical protein
MKKSELKKILKPLVSECIKESLLEDGLISGVIAEVVKGMATASPASPVVQEPTPPTGDDLVMERMKRNAFQKETTDKLQSHKKKLMSAIGGDAYNGMNLFEGTTPAPAQASETAQASPVAGQEPSDPGVDITNLFGAVGRNWNAHMTEMKERK